MKPVWQVEMRLELVRYEGDWNQDEVIDDEDQKLQRFVFNEFTDLKRAEEVFHKLLDIIFRAD